ncbi:MAG: LemA family protein [Planctomycetes bacterium]|nr:LemA family protein [Planctomycetota bacterium]
MEPLLFIGIPLLLLLIWLIGTWNGLVRLRNHCNESWSGIDTELKRRYDLIPNLVAAVKGYAKHERETFEAVVEARTRAKAATGTPSQQADAENGLVRALRGLFIVSESYPDLKASTNFLALQRQLSNTEDRIQSSRRFYNANVRDMNNRVEAFPSNIIANMGGFSRREFFEVEDAGVREVPKIDLGSGGTGS